VTRVLVVLGGVAAIAAAGCGSSSNGGGSSKSAVGNATHTQVPKGAKQGGSVRFLASGDVDYLDPGQDYYTFGFQVQYAVNRPLYSYKPSDPATPVPDLADSNPKVSADRKTITVHIRSGVKYAPPVNREVTSADVKYAIERAFTTSVPSGYANVYFKDIVGAPATPVKYSALKDFPGLQTPDDRTLVIKLTKPSAPTVVGALVLPITVPVPREYASKFDKKAPSDYDSYVAFTGPYIVKNDAKTGKVTGRKPGKSLQMVRNPNWDRSTDFRPAYLDAITIDEGNSDTVVAVRRTVSGSHLMCCDASHPPASLLKNLLTKTPELLGRVPGGGEHYDSLNTKIKPLDNLNVRKAIIAGTDRNAIRLVSGGAAIGPIAQGYIPPGMPGFAESGGEKGFTDLDWMQYPGGSAAVARKYMNLAAKDGIPVKNGKYAGKGELTAVVANTPDSLKGAEVVQAGMTKLGFKVKIRQLPQDTLYTKFCSVPKNEPAICIGIGWVKDFPDPQTMLQATFEGANIKEAGNSNWPQLDVPAIDAAIENAAKIPAGPARWKAFAAANKLIVEQAATILTIWDDTFQTQSKDVAGVMNGYTTGWDFSFSSVK
jgi:peptide/nickel transport system substrate-binding protein